MQYQYLFIHVKIIIYSLGSSPITCRQSALVDTDENQMMYTLRPKLLPVDSKKKIIALVM